MPSGGRVIPSADGREPELDALIDEIALIDHHTHSIVRGDVAGDDYILMLSESNRPAAARAAGLDTHLGYAVRRWCSPLLGLAPNAPQEEFLAVRLAMSNEEAAARLLPAAGLARLIVDTGFRSDELVSTGDLARLAGAPVSTVVRLEAVAEAVATSGVTAAGFGAAFVDAVGRELAAGAVGVKSIAAYRFGLDFEPRRPSGDEVAAAVGRWLREVEETGLVRVSDPALLRFLLWTGVDTGLPVQIHTGFGDPDLDLARADPLLLTEFVRVTDGRTPVLLLHAYPFHRQAAYLAHMFPNVWVDVGLALNYAGAGSTAILAEALEVAPFRKMLFSSDAWGLPELQLLGAVLFRRALSRILGDLVTRGDWSLHDAARVLHLIAVENAREVYRLDGR